MPAKKKLDNEEQALLDAYEKGEHKSQLTPARRAALEGAARETAAKNSRITIRLSSTDLQKLREKAAAIGIPYQTLIGSLVHQYAQDKILVSM